MGKRPKVKYVEEPEDKEKFTAEFDKFYTSFAKLYMLALKIFPFWDRWLSATLPHIRGPRVLEVSFGTGSLLQQYVSQFETYGIDYNEKFVQLLQEKLTEKGLSADIRQGDVQALPYDDAFFDTLVNTMAFTAYPDGVKAMAEMHRVLKPGGRLVMVDIDYPRDRNWLGMQATRAWIAMGDIIRDMGPLFDQFNFTYNQEEIGGFGSVHLWVAEKR
jgi:ubiquinone/menaquinone biosynthesis C-methylase UbiE